MNSCNHLIKEKNFSSVLESEYKSLADKLYLETLTVKDSKKFSPFCLHHGMEQPIASKAAKTAVAMKDVDVDIDPDGDVSSMKVGDGSWMSALNDVEKGSE